MQINGSVALVTGGNRGLGEQFVRALLDAGAAKVYAGSRDPGKVTVPGAVPLGPGRHRPGLRARRGRGVLDGPLDDFRTEFETHVLGSLAMTRALAPALARAGGGAILNVLSVLSWFAQTQAAAYCAAKSAEWSVTNGARLALAEQGTQVTALHVGYMDTDMVARLDVPKMDPAKVARLALDGVEAGLFEVLADDVSKQAEAVPAGGVAALYQELAQPAAS